MKVSLLTTHYLARLRCTGHFDGGNLFCEVVHPLLVPTHLSHSPTFDCSLDCRSFLYGIFCGLLLELNL